MSGFGFIEVLIALGLSATLSVASLQSVRKIVLQTEVAQQQSIAFSILDAAHELSPSNSRVLVLLRQLPDSQISENGKLTWINRQQQLSLELP